MVRDDEDGEQGKSDQESESNIAEALRNEGCTTCNATSCGTHNGYHKPEQ